MANKDLYIVPNGWASGSTSSL